MTSATLGRSKGQARRGQSLIEYVLLTALLSTAAVGFMKFYGGMLGRGFAADALPAKVGACISHQGGVSGQCQ